MRQEHYIATNCPSWWIGASIKLHAGEDGGSAVADQLYPLPLVRFPMQYRNFAVRMKICPSEIAGELSV